MADTQLAAKRVRVFKRSTDFRAAPGVLDVSPGGAFDVKNLTRDCEMRVLARDPLSANAGWVGHAETVQVTVSGSAELGYWEYRIQAKPKGAPDSAAVEVQGNSSPGVIIDR